MNYQTLTLISLFLITVLAAPRPAFFHPITSPDKFPIQLYSTRLWSWSNSDFKVKDAKGNIKYLATTKTFALTYHMNITTPQGKVLSACTQSNKAKWFGGGEVECAIMGQMITIRPKLTPSMLRTGIYMNVGFTYSGFGYETSSTAKGWQWSLYTTQDKQKDVASMSDTLVGQSILKSAIPHMGDLTMGMQDSSLELLIVTLQVVMDSFSKK